MEFGVNGDANGVVVGTVELEDSRAGDENEIVINSAEEDFQQDQDDKVDKESLGKDAILDGVPSIAMVPADEPYVGQEFESEAAAHAFYNTYATRVGFIIRVSKLSRSRRDGSAIGRALVCNKEGYRMPDKREKIVRQRAETRVGCRAMILVRKVSSGKWVVTKFVKEHTHPLTPGKGRRDCIYDQYPAWLIATNTRYLDIMDQVLARKRNALRMRRIPSLVCVVRLLDHQKKNEHDKIRELSQQLALEKKRAATYKRHLELIFEQIEEHNESLSKKIQRIVDSVREMENREQQSRV